MEVSREAVVLIAALAGTVVAVGVGLFALACWAEYDSEKQRERTAARHPAIGVDQHRHAVAERLSQQQRAERSAWKRVH